MFDTNVRVFGQIALRRIGLYWFNLLVFALLVL